MLDRNALSGALLLLTVASPALAQDTQPSTPSEDVIQDPMPSSRAQASEPSASEAAPAREKATPKKVALSINPAMLLFGGIGAEVDAAVGPAVSLFLAPSVVFGNSIFSPPSDVSVGGFGLEGGLRLFFGQQAPKGFWLGPYGGFGIASASFGNVTADATVLRFGGMLGYSWITREGFYFSLGAGGGTQQTTVSSPYGRTEETGPMFALRLAIGLAL
ncbi:hypothetical protein ACN28S_01300 [Cystobacter fuscus]